MCYHYRTGAALGGIAVIAAGWALETHRVATETILGAALGLEALAVLGAVLWAFRKVREYHSPEHELAHVHTHPIHQPRGWPHQAWERARERGN